jgi:hypothetical protein
VPWGFFESWLYLQNTSGASSIVPQDIYEYIPLSKQSNKNSQYDRKQETIVSFVKSPVLEPFENCSVKCTDDLLFQSPTSGSVACTTYYAGGSNAGHCRSDGACKTCQCSCLPECVGNGNATCNFNYSTWISADPRLRGPDNQTAKVVVAKGCDVYDFKSTFFDFFRIYYKAEGWMAIIRNLVLKMEVFYECEPSSGLYLSPCTPFYILPSNRTREQNSSWAAAQDFRMFIKWRDEQKSEEGEASFFDSDMDGILDEDTVVPHVLVLTGGLRTAPYNLTGYYILVDQVR